MLKPISNTSTAAVAWPHDPAFDATPEEIERTAIEMAEDLGAWRKLKVKAGEQPTLFTVGVIPPSVLTMYEDQCGIEVSRLGLRGNTRSLYWLCFKRGIQALAGYPPAWLYNAKEVPTTDPGHGQPKHLDPLWLEQHFNGELRQCALFIGMVVYRWQDLAGRDAKN